MSIRVCAEDALLIAAAGGRCALDADERVDVRWERLLERARWHRMAPLLWQHLRDSERPVPQPVRDCLHAAVRDTTARGLLLQAELDRALAALSERGIPAVLLKGAALVDCVYSELGLRPMVDLDLLIPAASVRRAHDTLQELGYAVAGARLTRDDEARLAEWHHHFPLSKSGGAVMIELHHGILPDRPRYDVDGIWQRARPGTGDPPRMLPAPEDLFLHVAVHFALDRINRRESSLGQLADMMRIIDQFPIDWDAVVERARFSGVADRLFLALIAAAVLFGDPRLRTVAERVQPAAYTPDRGDAFITQRVLAARPTPSLEQLSVGPRRLFAGLPALEYYVRPTDHTVPRHSTLRARRVAALTRRLMREAPRGRRLIDDVRLSRWMLSLRD